MKAGNRSNEPDMSSEVSIIRIPPHHYIHVLDQNTNIARIEVGPLTYIRQDNERSDWAGSGSGSGSGAGSGSGWGLGLGPARVRPEPSSSALARVLFSPVHMIMVPPRHYCVVLNPVARNQDGEVLFDPSGQAKLRHADLEIRLAQDPFPLYPGEEIQQVRLQLLLLCRDLQASVSFLLHLFLLVSVVQDVTPLQIVYPDTALRLQALLDFQEDGGEKRVAGDEWLFEGPGTGGRRGLCPPGWM